VRVSSLGNDRNSRLHLGVVLGHEAHRDGVYNGEEGQRKETFESVLAHTAMAMEMENDYNGLIASDETLSQDVENLKKAIASKDLGKFEGYVGASYDSSADYWKLVKDKDGNSYLEYDGRKDIYDEDDNFLVGADVGEKAFQTSLSEYLGISMDDAYDLMVSAGMNHKGISWNLDENMGKRISVGGKTDSDLTSYMYTAHHHNEIMDSIISAVNAPGNENLSRQEIADGLKENDWVTGVNGGEYAQRYLSLKDSMVNFYLGSGSIDDKAYYISQKFGPASEDTRKFYEMHTGIDAANPEGTPLTAPWSGKVDVADRSDNVGNMLEVKAGYMFEDKKMSAGFAYGSMHMQGLSIENKELLSVNSPLGYSGNTGSMVTGKGGGYHNHFTIFDNGYGNNRYLSEVLKIEKNSSSWVVNGEQWKWKNDAERRFYDPKDIYNKWFRK